jgi:hypothetical protein
MTPSLSLYAAAGAQSQRPACNSASDGEHAPPDEAPLNVMTAMAVGSAEGMENVTVCTPEPPVNFIDSIPAEQPHEDELRTETLLLNPVPAVQVRPVQSIPEPMTISFPCAIAPDVVAEGLALEGVAVPV